MALGTDQDGRSGAGQSAVAGDGSGGPLGGVGGRGARGERTSRQRPEEVRSEAQGGSSAQTVPSSSWSRSELFYARATGDQCGSGARRRPADGHRDSADVAEGIIRCGQTALQLGQKAQAQGRAQAATPTPAKRAETGSASQAASAQGRRACAPQPAQGAASSRTGGAACQASGGASTRRTRMRRTAGATSFKRSAAHTRTGMRAGEET